MKLYKTVQLCKLFVLLFVANCEKLSVSLEDQCKWCASKYGQCPSSNRSIRATDHQLSTAVERIQRIARLTAGITIQIGLFDRKIDVDELTSELLRIGTVTPSQISSLNFVGILKLIDNELVKLASNLGETAEVKKVEWKLEQLEELRTLVQTVGNSTTWEAEKAFEADMNSIKTIDLTLVKSAKTVSEKWKSRLIDIRTTNYTTSYDFLINDLKSLTEELIGIGKSLGALKSKPWKYGTIESAVKSLDQIPSMIRAVDEIFNLTNVYITPPIEDQDGMRVINSNSERLSNLSGALKKYRADLQVVRKAIYSRTRGYDGRYSGISNGANDIVSIFSDLSDDWMKRIGDMEHVAASLRPLKTLEPAFQKIEKAMPQASEKKLSAIDTLLELVETILKVPEDVRMSRLALDDVWSCQVHFRKLKKPDTSEVEAFLKSAREMDKIMEEVNAKFEVFFAFASVKSMKLLEDVKALCVLGDAATLKASYDNLRASDKVDQVNNLLKRAEDVFDSVQTDSLRTQTPAEQLLADVSHVTQFFGEAAQFYPLFGCLSERPRMEKVLSLIRTSRKVHETPNVTEAVKDVKRMIQDFQVATKDLNTLKPVFAKVLTMKSLDSEALRSLPDPRHHMEVMGAMALTMGRFWRALRMKKHAEVFFRDSNILDEKLLLTVNVTLNDAERTQMKSLLKMKNQMEKTFLGLEKWRSNTFDTGSTTVKSFKQLFEAASEVDGFDVHHWKSRELLEQLAPRVNQTSVKNQLIQMKNALDTLYPISFSTSGYTHEFQESGKSLDALDLFFASFRAKTNAAVVGQMENSSPAPEEQVTEANGSPLPAWFLIFCGFTISTLIYMVVTSLLWFDDYRNSQLFRSRNNHNDNEFDSDSGSSTSSTPVTAGQKPSPRTFDVPVTPKQNPKPKAPSRRENEQRSNVQDIQKANEKLDNSGEKFSQFDDELQIILREMLKSLSNSSCSQMARFDIGIENARLVC